jgi:sugar/nucleoside kinase (ribokinase family)
MKILGIGNALVDILTMIKDENLLQEMQLPKGSMQLVDAEKSALVQQFTAAMEKKQASGGSASNTIHGLAQLGVETAFIGHVGLDATGDFFEQDMKDAGIKPILFRSKTPSGIANAMITQDGERTFATYLGAAVELSEKHLNASIFQNYDLLYVEGYLVQNEALLINAMKLAKQAGMKIVIDLASYNVVEANIDLLKKVINDYVDIVFANEEEAKAFTGKDPEAALEELATMCETAIVKIGAKGSLIQSNNKIHRIGVIEVNAIDTTGAGDLFAAGFLYGYAQGWDFQKAGQLGALLSGRVIETVGPKLTSDSWNQIKLAMQSI